MSYTNPYTFSYRRPKPFFILLGNAPIYLSLRSQKAETNAVFGRGTARAREMHGGKATTLNNHHQQPAHVLKISWSFGRARAAEPPFRALQHLQPKNQPADFIKSVSGCGGSSGKPNENAIAWRTAALAISLAASLSRATISVTQYFDL